MANRRFIPYRIVSTSRARDLRRNATAAERKLWHELLRDLPAKFTRQKPLGAYIVDFYCSSRRLALEVDGDSHFNDAAERYDERRTAALGQLGVRVLRFTNDEVLGNFEAVCDKIVEAVRKS